MNQHYRIQSLAALALCLIDSSEIRPPESDSLPLHASDSAVLAQKHQTTWRTAREAELQFNFFAFIAAVGVLITEFLWTHSDQAGTMNGATLAPDEWI